MSHAPVVTLESPVRGRAICSLEVSPTAPVTLLEYGDFECLYLRLRVPGGERS